MRPATPGRSPASCSATSASDERERSLKRSKQGEIILEELKQLTTHPRSDELYALVRRRLPRVSLGTVYRNLDRCQREGVVTEIYCGDFVRYDGNVSPHDHFLCRGCHRVWDFDRGHSAIADEVEVDLPGFRVEGHYTIFYGLCAACQGGSNSLS